MSNTNCLEGTRCPNCGNDSRFFISGNAEFDVTDGGSEAVGDHEWDDDSATRCPECGHHGVLKDFRVRRQLPPDSDGMNGSRAEWAEYALVAFESQAGTDRENALGDLLGGLMHWCDRNGFDFDLALERARGHYEAETGGVAP